MNGFGTFALGFFAILACSASTLKAAPPELTWESANARRMFVVTSDRGWNAAIVVDTTHPDELRVATRLQELVYRIGGSRLPVVDREFVSVEWGKIFLKWDGFPMTFREHSYVIEMKQTDPTSANPPKQIVIAGSEPATLEQAVSAFTKAAFGIPLEALDDRDFKWQRTSIVAIPENFGPIRADRSKGKGSSTD